MKNNINRKFIKKRKKNSDGFTLVELLATLAILSLVSVIVIYTATNVISNAKEKSYMVTINNIQNESRTYVLENDKNIVWLDDGSNYLYQCVTVQNLIDMGYFSNEILDSKINENRNVLASDYIYIEKDKATKVITKNILLYHSNSQINGLCGVDLVADGIIEFNIPSGFAKSKEITITYNLLKSSVGSLSNYNYSYLFDADVFSNKDIEEQTIRFNNKNKIVKKIIVNDNGWMFAKIDKIDDSNINSKSIYVDGIDINGPTITSNVNSTIVRGNAIIPIIINDSGSGINGDSINLSNFKVSIGDNLLTDNYYSFERVSGNLNTYNYNLKIENYNYAGEVKITIDTDKILDNLGNGNINTTINTGVIFNNEYTISYDKNSGTGSMSNIICIYGKECVLTRNAYVRKGYTFLGWSVDKNATSAVYIDEYKFNKFEYKNDVTLYAVWKANTYTIKYNANGGSGSMSNTSCTYDSNCTLRGNAFTKTGYTFNGWNTKSDGSGTNYTNSQVVKNLVTSNNGSITLYAKWKANTYTIKYNANGGSGSMSNTSCTYDVNCTLRGNAFTKTGYTFNGWNTKSDGSGTSYSNKAEIKNLVTSNNGSITLYAKWKLDAFYLYNEGEESVKWIGRGWATDSVSPTKTVNLSRGTSSIKMTFGSYNRQSGAMVTSTMVDITNFNTLTFTGNIKPAGYKSDKAPYGYMFISQNFSETTNKTKKRRVSLPVGSSAKTVSLDISDYSGEWYIVVYMYTYDSTSMPTTITKSVKLTK